MNEDDDAECAKSAGLQPGEVVARDVLHHTAAALDHASVARHERHAKEVVLDRAEAVSQRPGGRRGDDRAKRAPREARRIDAQPCAAVGELLAQLVQSDPGFRGGG